jgi:cell division septal protein FtsQ
MMKKIFYLVGVIAVLILILSPFFITQFLINVKIECQSQFGECPPELNSKLKNQNSKNLWQSKSEVTKIVKTDSLVSDFSMQYKLPNILLVNLIVKKPLYAIKDSSTGKIFSVDKDGKILSEISSTSLPLVVQDGQTPNIFALKLILGVYQMYQVGYGTITNDALVVDIPHGLRVIFPLEGDSEVLLGGLRLIYAKITTDYLGTYSQIDMRYKNPVLK